MRKSRRKTEARPINERTSGEADFQPTRHDTFALIGTLLLLTQDTEEKIALALRVVFKNGIITAEDFVRKDKKTLGQLVREIRHKMHVDKSFEGLLLAFVEQRNLFVHHLQSQAWFDVESTAGINQVWQALGKYMHNLEQVALTFNAYWMRFAEITGTPKGEWWAKLEESGFLPHLRKVYYPKLGFALKPKRHE
jgi:hypothetical protein